MELEKKHPDFWDEVVKVRKLEKIAAQAHFSKQLSKELYYYRQARIKKSLILKKYGVLVE